MSEPNKGRKNVWDFLSDFFKLVSPAARDFVVCIVAFGVAIGVPLVLAGYLAGGGKWALGAGAVVTVSAPLTALGFLRHRDSSPPADPPATD